MKRMGRDREKAMFARLNDVASFWPGLYKKNRGKFYRGTSKGKGLGFGALGAGLYLSWDKDMAKSFGKDVATYSLPKDLKLLDAQSKTMDDLKAMMGFKPGEASDDPAYAKALKMMVAKKGYDGVISDELAEGIVVFDEKKAKKISPRRYSPETERMLRSRVGWRVDSGEWNKPMSLGDLLRDEAYDNKHIGPDVRKALGCSIKDVDKKYPGWAGLWLGGKDMVEEHYGEGEKDSASEIEIPKGAKVICDMSDGTLLALPPEHLAEEKKVKKISPRLTKVYDKLGVGRDVELSSLYACDLPIHISRAVAAGDVASADILRKHKGALDLREKARLKEFGARFDAAREFERELRVNGYRPKVTPSGTVIIYHGTSKDNADKIMREGVFKEFTFFSHAKDKSAFGSGGAKSYGPVILKIEADPRDIWFNSGSGEIEAEEGLVREIDGVWRKPKRVGVY